MLKCTAANFETFLHTLQSNHDVLTILSWPVKSLIAFITNPVGENEKYASAFSFMDLVHFCRNCFSLNSSSKTHKKTSRTVKYSSIKNVKLLYVNYI